MWKLTWLSGNSCSLRTAEVVGIARCLPKPGVSFSLLARPLNPEADVRLVMTSRVVEVEELEHDVYNFRTINSCYRLEPLAS